MKRRIIILALFVTTLASAQTEHIVKLGTRMMSLEAVNSYPQKLLEVCENSDTAVIVRIKTFNEWEDLETVNRLRQAPCISDKVYDAHLQRYLQPTTYVNSHSETTKRVADSLFTGKEKTMVEMLRKALAISSSLKFDNQLAQRIYNGEVNCANSDDALKSKEGTCSECTNIFLALMRSRNIPARFVSGMVFNQGNMTFHAWAEVWFDGFGWWAVDPQTGNEMTPYYFYKLHTGVDFHDCGVECLKDYRFKNESIIINEEWAEKYRF